MRKSRFTEEQITAVLAECKAAQSPAEVCRRHGISMHTYYNWRKKYGGMQSDDVRKLRALEAENSKLKRVVADLTLDNLALKEIVSKNW